MRERAHGMACIIRGGTPGVHRSGAWQAWRESLRLGGMSQFARNLVPSRNLVPNRCLGRKSEPSWEFGPNLAPPAVCREADARDSVCPNGGRYSEAPALKSGEGVDTIDVDMVQGLDPRMRGQQGTCVGICE